MIHWNGNQLCAIDVETTGLDPNYHELIQIAILPLDSEIKPRTDVLPFYIELKPEHPERADSKAMHVNKLKMADINVRGFDRLNAIGLFEEWVKKLGLPYTKYGNPKQIIPLGHNYTFDCAFIKAWLGTETYYHYFHYHHRDTMVVANYLNDRANVHAEPHEFAKASLEYLASVLGVPRSRAHDALCDCQTTAEVYRLLLRRGVMG